MKHFEYVSIIESLIVFNLIQNVLFDLVYYIYHLTFGLQLRSFAYEILCYKFSCKLQLRVLKNFR